MPLIADSQYRSPLLLANGHLQTIYPVLFRRIRAVPFRRERIDTDDGDFLDLDWLQHALPTAPARPLAILTHGLEGSAQQGYIKAMANALFQNDWDVLAWNLRGCSGETNRLLRSYHSGATEDLQRVIDHAATRHSTDCGHHRRSADCGHHQHSADCDHHQHSADCDHHLIHTDCDHSRHDAASVHARRGHTDQARAEDANARRYRRIALIGFSLGGNLTLKYVGDRCRESATGPQPLPGIIASRSAPECRITHAVGISVPCDLAGSTEILERRHNRVYMERFLKTLRRKIHAKHRQFPSAVDISGIRGIRTFREFDDRYTAPIHGFKNADAYWHACSCLRNLHHTHIPTLLLNAQDDPFLSPGCFPIEVVREHPFVHLEMPGHGGHMGFIQLHKDRLYYSERRTVAFLNEAV